MEAMAGGPHQHGLALDGTHTSDFLLVGAVQEKVLGGQKASIAERRKYYAAKRMERMNGGQGGPNAGTEKLRAKMQEAQRGEGEAPVTFRDKRAHYAAKRMEVVARDDKLQQAMQININKGEARVGAYTAKARHRMPKVGLNLERVSKSKEKDDDERSDRIAGAKDKSVAKDGPQSSRRFKSTPQGKHVSRLTVQSPSSVMQTDVRDLDTEHIGMIVATTLDGLTVDGGPTPSCNDLIEAAQKTLSAMGVTGVLFNRKKEIEMLYFQLVEEDGPATPRSARGPEVSADVFQLTYDQIGLIVATTLDGLTAPSYDGGPPKPPPTCSELIAAAQTTLTAMGVGGVLAKRREEIELVYLELTAEEEESDIPTGVDGLTYDQIGMIVATTLDGLTAPSTRDGPPNPAPTCEVLIAAAQVTLSAMGLGGDLAARHVEIEAIYRELIEDDDIDGIPEGIAALTYEQIGLVVATTLDGMTAPSEAGGELKPCPPVDALIASAQTALSKMGLAGELASRKDEVVEIYTQLMAEDEGDMFSA